MKCNKLMVPAVFFLFHAATIFAVPSLQVGFVSNYPFTRETVLDNCATCHMPADTSFLNPYGRALRDAKMDFRAIENLDSDGDGVSNFDEIKALKFPGSRAEDPETFVFTNKMGTVIFNHGMHVVEDAYISKGRCSNCHGLNLIPKRYDDTVSIRSWAHQTCWRCHKMSGNEHAPTMCDGCHKSK